MSDAYAAIQELVGVTRPFPVTRALRKLVDKVQSAGGRPLAVGGAIRDHLMGLPEKDIDIEVYGISLEVLENALSGFEVHAVGRSFGVLKVGVDDETFDVALPRRESKNGTGHRGFVVESDPHMDPRDAAARRDFTVNAIAWDLEKQVLVDPWNGVDDLRAGILRHVSPAFDEDPLRVLRAAQFASRFSFQVHDSTLDRCRALRPELATLAKERIWGEMEKLALKGVWPSIGLNVLLKVGAVEALFPELLTLCGCEQEFEWHPEGDVWFHTMLVVDEAARIAREEQLDDGEKLRLVLGALCHDLGKPPTTEYIDGRVRSRDHESQGEEPTRAFLERMGAPNEIVDDVVALVRDHLKPFQLFRDNASDGAIRRLALRVPVPRLVRVARADHFGRTTPDALQREDEAGAWLVERAKALDVEAQAPKPILQGRHLIPRGVKPGPDMGALLREAFDAQLEGKFHDETGAIAWLEERLK
jgi:tRNA nucleotidyltransferase (CCA-adding enzyme)